MAVRLAAGVRGGRLRGHRKENNVRMGMTRRLTDVFTAEKRSWVMSRIRGTNTGIEIRMRNMLGEAGYLFDEQPKMHGSPDFVLQRGIAVFCDGDFWHGYEYMRGRRPAGEFWRGKIEGNMRRDRRHSRYLRRAGWSVLRFWEHDIQKNPERCMSRIGRKFAERKTLPEPARPSRGVARKRRIQSKDTEAVDP